MKLVSALVSTKTHSTQKRMTLSRASSVLSVKSRTIVALIMTSRLKIVSLPKLERSSAGKMRIKTL